MSVVVVVGVVLVGMLLFMIPIVFLANKAIGATFEREAQQMKQRLAQTALRFSEDGVRLRSTTLAPFAVGARWMLADVRVDAGALYVMRYTRGLRIGQPNFRITWVKEPRLGGFHAMPIIGRPIREGEHVVLATELGLSAMRLCFSPRDPAALLAAIEAMR